MNYYKSATERKSTRDFKEKAVSSGALNEIKEYFKGCKRLVPDIDVEMTILDPKSCPNMNGCVGYEDFLIEAPQYILLTSDKCENYILNAGFIGEDIVLKLTDMGIATCWITINDSAKLKERLRLADKEPVALIAIGYENALKTTKRLDIVNLSNVNLKKRSNYEAPKLYVEDAIYSEDIGIKATPSTLEDYHDLNQALVAACCAPSFLNRQPYRFIINDGYLMVAVLDDDKTNDNDKDLNIGILMLNLYGVLSERSGAYGKWELSPAVDIEKPDNSEIAARIHI